MILDRIDQLVDDFEMFDDDLEKYEYIIDLGKSMKAVDENLLKDEFIIKGCLSKVWLIPEYDNGILNFRGDSNSVIVKGLVFILISIFNSLEPTTINSFDFNELKRLKLDEIISPSRQNGVFHMVEKIKHYAQIYRNDK